jgi:hypothetical protein
MMGVVECLPERIDAGERVQMVYTPLHLLIRDQLALDVDGSIDHMPGPAFEDDRTFQLHVGRDQSPKSLLSVHGDDENP